MGMLSDMKQRIKTEAERAIVEEAVRRLETAVELKDQGKEAEGDRIVNDMIAWLEDMIQGIENTIGSEERPVVERSSLPQAGEVVAEGDKIVLGVLKEEEKEKYLAVTCEYSCMKGAYKDEKFREMTWNDFLSDSTFDIVNNTLHFLLKDV